MEKITKYLSTKVNKLERFPNNLSFDVVIDFLQKKGFKLLQYDINSEEQSFIQLNKYAQKSDSNIYMLPNKISVLKSAVNNGHVTWVRICKPGKIGRKNPSFFISLSDDGNFDDRNIIAYIEYEPYGRLDTEYSYNELNAFIEEVNKNFGW